MFIVKVNMINHILYSRLLFPILKKNSTVNNYTFLDITEIKKWVVKLTFLFRQKDTREIYLVYKPFYWDQKKFLSWSQSLGVRTYGKWLILSKDNNLIKFLTSLLKDRLIKEFPFYHLENFNRYPFWVVLTTTPTCNLSCIYCFNEHEFDLRKRNKLKYLSFEQWQIIIDKLYNYWMRTVILSGWEPLTYPYIWDLLDYLKEKRIYTYLNTNWTLLTPTILDRLNKNYAISLMVSMHEFNPVEYANIQYKWFKKIHGSIVKKEIFEKMFYKKIENLKLIKNYSNLKLQFLTILTPKNILRLEKIYDRVENQFSWIEYWHFFRLYTTEFEKWISRWFMRLGVEKLYYLNKKFNRNWKIVDAVPFCVTDPNIWKEVIEGELDEIHMIKWIVTVHGDFQIMSAFDRTEWNLLEKDIKSIRESEFIQGMLKNKFLPDECKDCIFKDKCKWWSRMEAHILKGSYKAFDPIGVLKNKISINC